MKIVLVAAGALILGVPAMAFAANADHPYQNVDHSNDAGNATGDSQVDRLNQAQLSTDGIPAGSYDSDGYRPVAPVPGYAPQAYYPPAPAYYAPRPSRPYYGYGY